MTKVRSILRSGLKIENKTIKGTYFTSGYENRDSFLYNVVFDNLHIKKCSFLDSIVKDSHIDEGDFEDITIKNMELSNFTMNNTKMYLTTIENLFFHGKTIITETDLKYVCFKKCAFQDVRFIKCSFDHVAFEDCKFEGVFSFLKKHLRTINKFSDTSMNDCVFKNCIFDEREPVQDAYVLAHEKVSVEFNKTTTKDCFLRECNTKGLFPKDLSLFSSIPKQIQNINTSVDEKEETIQKDLEEEMMQAYFESFGFYSRRDGYASPTQHKEEYPKIKCGHRFFSVGT